MLKVSVARYAEPSERKRAMNDSAILVEGLIKRFGDVTALGGIDFDVPAGTVFGLLGPNGAGKTTAVRVLSTVIAPDGGRAEVLGQDVVRQADTVRQLIGLAGQFAAVDPNLTGRENLRLIGRLTQLPWRGVDARASELLERFGLSEAADRPVRTYSGGMRRRLDVGAALVHRPQVLFFDEPTTGLDPEGRNELWEVIRELVHDGTTVLLTTQYLEEADRLADRIVVIDGGKVIADDTPAALKGRMGSTVTELRFGDESRATAAELLIGQVNGVRAELDGTLVRMTSEDAARTLIDVLRDLDERGLAPTGLTVREPSLDDVFLSLTGRHVEADTTPNDDELAKVGVA
jgi:ABC-2 type transport system ATP-binding protein